MTKLTKLEKAQLERLLNKAWIFHALLEVTETKKDYRDLNGVTPKRAEILLYKLLASLKQND